MQFLIPEKLKAKLEAILIEIGGETIPVYDFSKDNGLTERFMEKLKEEINQSIRHIRGELKKPNVKNRNKKEEKKGSLLKAKNNIKFLDASPLSGKKTFQKISSKDLAELWDESLIINVLKEQLRILYLQYVRYCPYCGKGNLFNIIRENQTKKIKVNYDLEHFLEKSKYPQLLINPFFLIPTCKACNQMKLDLAKKGVSGDFFHPCNGWVNIVNTDQECAIEIQPQKHFADKVSFGELNLPDIPEIEDYWGPNGLKHIDFFSLNPIYKHSFDTHKDILFLYDRYLEMIATVENSRFSEQETSERIDGVIKSYLSNWYPLSKDEILSYPNGFMRMSMVAEAVKLLGAD